MIQGQKGCTDAQAADPRLGDNPWHNSCAFTRRRRCHATSRERARLWDWPALDGRHSAGRIRVCRNDRMEAKVPERDHCGNGWGADRTARWRCADRESPDSGVCSEQTVRSRYQPRVADALVVRYGRCVGVGTNRIADTGSAQRSLLCHCGDAHHTLLCYFLQSAFCGTCGLAIARGFCRQRDDRSSGLPDEEYPGSVVGNPRSNASLRYLFGFCWGHHPSMDEPRIPERACTGSQVPGPIAVCTRCGGAVACQRDRTCCATTVCAIRSPAYGNRCVCCVSDLVDLP